jgi:hypothetical protein
MKTTSPACPANLVVVGNAVDRCTQGEPLLRAGCHARSGFPGDSLCAMPPHSLQLSSGQTKHVLCEAFKAAAATVVAITWPFMSQSRRMHDWRKDSSKPCVTLAIWEVANHSFSKLPCLNAAAESQRLCYQDRSYDFPLPSFIYVTPLNLPSNLKRLLMHDKALDPHDFQAKGEHPSCAGLSFPQK